MSNVVIDPTSSVLSFPQWLLWNFQFTASNMPYNWTISSGSFPPGMNFQAKYSVTSSSGLITATGSAFNEGTPLVFSALGSGGSAYTASTVVYYATRVSGVTFSLATSPGGAPITSGTNITNGSLYQPGLLSGQATAPGIYKVNMVATNSTGDSPAVPFTIGIEAAAAAPDTNTDLVWDFGSNAVIVQTSSVLNVTPAPRTTPIIFVKEQDDLIVRVRAIKNSSILDLGLVGASNPLKLVLKQFEPEAQIVISDGSVQIGSNDANSLLLHAQFSGDTLKSALSNYETDTGTLFSALAELEVTFPNPGYTVGPDHLRRTSQTFTVQIERDLGESS